MAGHISGMPDFDSNPWHDAAYDQGALERFVRDFVSLKFLTADPGTKYQYCNTAYEVLGDVISKASGVPFEDYLHDGILQPLGMENSTLLFREVDKTQLTSPHYLKDGEVTVSDIYPYNRMHGPSSTLVSNLDDMTRFVQMWLNHGTFEGVRILNEESVTEMWSPAAGKFDNVGVSWRFRDHNGHRVIYHGGSDVGYKSYVLLLPDSSLGMVFMTNSIAPPTADLSKGMTDILLGLIEK
jgi:CubicO group peptidase (beta-lactamase class C family)